jgi:IS5 family transposase
VDFGMKAHIAVDAHSGPVHTVTTTAANEADVEQIADRQHAPLAHRNVRRFGLHRFIVMILRAR